LLRYDVRQGASMLRRNSRTIRSWIEEEGAAGGKEARAKMREIAEGKTSAKGPEAPKTPEQ